MTIFPIAQPDVKTTFDENEPPVPPNSWVEDLHKQNPSE